MCSYRISACMWLVVFYSVIMQANHFVFYNKNYTHCNHIVVTIIAVNKLNYSDSNYSIKAVKVRTV